MICFGKPDKSATVAKASSLNLMDDVQTGYGRD
jgi:hypothetical protein